MNPLFAKSSLMILESLSFTNTLYAFDFDGTLSRIVKTPSEATLARVTEGLLRELARYVPVAIISGRSIADLKERLAFEPMYLVGNHGLEGLGSHRDSLQRAEADCAAWKSVLQSVRWHPGIDVEDKTYSLAIHYRRSRNKKLAKEQIHAALAMLSPEPRVLAGKSVVNLLPAGAPHKGMAVMELMRKAGARHSFYIGDDDTDEDVFSLPDDSVVMTVRVGQKRSSSARYYIDRQSEINRVLKCLIRFHRHEKKRSGGGR